MPQIRHLELRLNTREGQTDRMNKGLKKNENHKYLFVNNVNFINILACSKFTGYPLCYSRNDSIFSIANINKHSHCTKDGEEQKTTTNLTGYTNSIRLPITPNNSALYIAH